MFFNLNSVFMFKFFKLKLVDLCYYFNAATMIMKLCTVAWDCRLVCPIPHPRRYTSAIEQYFPVKFHNIDTF